jgi:3-mercaptopyruvate sulfurtransferase SseA
MTKFAFVAVARFVMYPCSRILLRFAQTCSNRIFWHIRVAECKHTKILHASFSKWLQQGTRPESFNPPRGCHYDNRWFQSRR